MLRRSWAVSRASWHSFCYLVHIGSGLGGRLHVLDAPLLGLPAGLVHRHLPPLLQVRLVPHQQQGDLVLLGLHAQDLLPAGDTVVEKTLI